MAKIKHSSISPGWSFCLALFVAVLLACIIWSITDDPHYIPALTPKHLFPSTIPPEKTFYDDPELSYSMGKPIVDWDKKRTQWLKLHPSFAAGVEKRVLLLTGSQPSPCISPVGDHLLLRLFKNKVDYCRIHGYDIFYNDAILNPKMPSVWAKVSLFRAAMLAHPETEWFLWMDSDAIFTDMDFKIPLDRYGDHNVVIHGWPEMIAKKSWLAVNTGIVLIRNCQWSMDFLDQWAGMSPKAPDHKRMAQIVRSTLTDKMFPRLDEQSALVYLLLKGRKEWTNKIYVENEYSLHGYWVEIVGRLDNITAKYAEIARGEPSLRRRHAEAVSESHAAAWEPHVVEGGEWKGKWRRPFVTHFAGCQPCSGDHNPEYGGDSCWVETERALNFADNQVLRNFGFMHRDLKTQSPLVTVPNDYPVQEK